MHAGFIVFGMTAGAVFAVHLRVQLPLWRSARIMEAELRELGRPSLWENFAFKAKFHSCPSIIFQDSDTAKLRELKQRVVDCRAAVFASLPRMLKMMFTGCGLAVVATIMQELLLRK